MVLVLLGVALLASTIYSMVKVYIANLRRKGFVLVRDTDSWTLQVSEMDVVGVFGMGVGVVSQCVCGLRGRLVMGGGLRF